MTMAHGVNTVLKRPCKVEGKTGIGSRRIFPPHFKLQVLDSYRNDVDCKGNQRATARKYGIHRRQIQKWLQVENNLRSSVKGKTAMPPQVVKDAVTLKSNEYGRQLGDGFPPHQHVQVEARVPQMLSPITEIVVPLDFTTHAREHASPIAGSPVPNFDPAAPMDLSLKRTTTGDHLAYTPILHQHSPISSATQFESSPYRTNPDVWDLSTKACKRKSDGSSADSTVANSKPVKLFKPYLDDLHEGSSNDDNSEKSAEIISSCCAYQCSYDYFNNNNNSAYETYTLHELQPKSSISHHYYYPTVTATYLYPNSECEVYYPYEESLQPLKQRQSYSLDFKLSAIECYHQDELCRGNQRAVATKYNIHRRQVQKWLQQEDELRERNETGKQIHVS
ncbi:trp repressor/replication initiator [Holotrichia oblita]|uniref:Trp repressor/replication initiator n=3 Tax=Holotrichia oblita TaxID=644536 RepID=A0ACB9TEV7_HOLOL|nr:trp repressor/replication initiator [Holotrichia oblita]KAI4458393.1 trp repressor/replication initiator [Holotrichia oblita]KAI4465343.1 trp repressor/replication initiator [Holotrichia oblita]